MLECRAIRTRQRGRVGSSTMAVDRRDDSERRAVRVKPLYLLAGLLVVCVVGVGVLILFPSLPDPTCASLLARSEEEVVISLPANCARSRNVASDDMVKYLEHERTVAVFFSMSGSPAGKFQQEASPL